MLQPVKWQNHILNKSITDHLANHLPIATVSHLGKIEKGKTFP